MTSSSWGQSHTFQNDVIFQGRHVGGLNFAHTVDLVFEQNHKMPKSK